MKFEELTTFLFKKYGLKFQPMLANSNKFFVLKAPKSPDFFAILSRIDNQFAGRTQVGHIVTLDVKCGDFAKTIRDLPGFSNPFRIKGDDWIGLWLDQVDKTTVEKVIDYAYKLAVNGKELSAEEQYIYIPPTISDHNQAYEAQTIPKRNAASQMAKNDVQDDITREIKQMIQSYDYSVLPIIGREKNFYQQGKLMADYQDDFAEEYVFKRYYPTYHDMTVPQLRTYFTWRTQVRQGVYQKTSTSYAFVYVYELLNNIGVSSPLDGFQKLIAFNQNYVQKYDDLVKSYLSGWLKDYLIFYNLDFEQYGRTIFRKELTQDKIYQDLLQPESEQKLFKALLELSGYQGKLLLPEEKMQSICLMVWQTLLADRELNYFENCIAQKAAHEVVLFSGAIFYANNQNKGEYLIDSHRKFYFDHGRWHYQYLLPIARQKSNLKILLHEIDRIVRAEYHLGRPLKSNQLDARIIKIISQKVKEFHQAEIAAKKPKITIDFGNLSQIRQDASVTRDSLLTDEEKKLEAEEQTASSSISKMQDSKLASAADGGHDYDLTGDESYFLLALLKKHSYDSYLKAHHLMASVLADSINEKLFDEIGDSVIEFNAQDQPEIIEDYQADLAEMFLRKD